MLLIYSPEITPRLTYIADTLLYHMGGVPVQLTSSPENLKAHKGAKICYAKENIAAELAFHLSPAALLFQNDILQQEIPVQQLSQYPVLFPVQEGDFPFDILAASFFLLSRYEEYLPHAKDEYGRFSHHESIAFQQGFLQKPLVNIWLKDFRKRLQRQFPFLIFATRNFRFLPTYDIDIAYSFLYKGFKRNLLGMFKDIAQQNWKALNNRVAVLRGRKKDPFDIYEWLYALHLKFNLRPYYFFLLARNPGALDKNINPAAPAMQSLIEYHGQGYPVGCHPSWQSGGNSDLLASEINMLETILQKKVVNSRQHYLRFTLPHTYRQLIEQGITNEFSMGYGSINGFRASVASSFLWYDLERNECTNLTIHPFCFMDANSLFEQKQTPAQAYEEMRSFHDMVKQVNGTMITIWHNHILGADPMFKGWRDVYETFLEQVLYWDI